jgi:RimJ/RimL family protein N-acetyltransferase
MKAFIRLKDNIIKKNLKPNSFKNFKFDSFENINHKYFFNLIKKDRVRKSFKNIKKITYEKHLIYLKNYKNKPILNFILICTKSKELVGLFNIKKTKAGYELGKVILKDKFLNKGIAKKATIETLNFFFKFFKAKTIFAETSIKNNVNIVLNSKIGFVITDLNKKFYKMKLTYVRFYNFCYKKK